MANLKLWWSFFLAVIKFFWNLARCYVVEFIRLINPPPLKSIQGEIVLVTGGSNGIGSEILLYLASLEKDITLISWDVDANANEIIVRKLRNLGVQRAFVDIVDVTDANQVAVAAKKIRSDFGTVTMLFNNAGIFGPTGKCWEMDLNQMRKAIDINLTSNFITVKEFLPGMITCNKGHIITTCSMAATTTGCHSAPYYVSKHGLRSFTSCIKEDLRKIEPPPNIVVSTAYPSLVDTKLLHRVNIIPKKYPFLVLPLTVSNAAVQLVQGALKNEEHIYIPGLFRWLAFFTTMAPSEGRRLMMDLVDIDFCRKN